MTGVQTCALPISAEACSLARSWARLTDTSLVRLRLTAERDTVYTGRWWLSPVSRGWRELRWPKIAAFPVFGQVVRVDDIAGGSGAVTALRAGLQKSRGRAVLVPLGIGADCAMLPWLDRSAAWIPARVPSVAIAVPRAPMYWVDGMPTFDVFAPDEPYPHSKGSAYDTPREAKAPWLPVGEYWELLNRVPPPTLTGRERDAALASLRAWVASRPGIADRFPANAMLRALESDP